MQPSDSLASVGRGFGSPCRRPTPMRALVLCRSTISRRCVRPQTHRASETDHRLSASPVAVEEKRGPPRFLGRPLPACRGRTPRRIRSFPRPTHGEVVVAFRQFSTLGIRDGIDFEAANPTAHTLACLRFAGLVAETVARLATGSGGLTLGRTGFAPAGRQTKFHGVIASSIPLRPAEPGRTLSPTPPPSPTGKCPLAALRVI